MLISDRSQAASMQSYWEFPGGKVKRGESAGAALRRELKEEIGVDAIGFEHFRRIDHDYADTLVSIDFYLVTCWQGTPTGLEGQQLRWVEEAAFNTDLLLPADVPVVAALRSRV